MNDSIETRQLGGIRLPGPVLQALSTLQARCRAWFQFQGRARELKRIRDNQRQNPAGRDLAEVETIERASLDTAQAGETAGALSSSYCFLLRVSAVERVHDERWFAGLYNSDLADIEARIDAIRQREGLNDDEDWLIGQGPEDWKELNEQYSQVLDVKFEEALREYGLNDIADLYHKDRKEYDARREQGRRLVFESIPKLEQLSTLQRQFEAEAGICAKGGAYHAAAIMIGGAMEAALLFACLNRRDDALNARNCLPNRERPKSTNPEDWGLAELTSVAGEAGWLADFEVSEGTILSRRLLDMMRYLRNLIHPARHLSDDWEGDVESSFTDAQAAYALLKWCLAESLPATKPPLRRPTRRFQ